MAEAAHGTYTKNAETAALFEDAHGSEADECTAHAVDEDGRTAAEHGCEQYAYDEYDEYIAGARQGIERDDGDEIGQAEFGSRSKEGHGNQPFKYEEGQGLGSKQAEIDEFVRFIHWMTSLFYRDDIWRSRGAGSLDFNHEFVRQADDDVAGAAGCSLFDAEPVRAVSIVDGDGIVVDDDMVMSVEILDVDFFLSMMFGELYTFLQASVNGDFGIGIFCRHGLMEDGQGEERNQKTEEDKENISFFKHRRLLCGMNYSLPGSFAFYTYRMNNEIRTLVLP